PHTTPVARALDGTPDGRCSRRRRACRAPRSGRRLTTHERRTMGIIGWIVLGLLAGVIAKAIFPGTESFGLILTTLLGIGGALRGGFLASLVGLGDPIDSFFDLSTWVAAVVGALLILWIASKLGIGRGHRSRLV